MRNIVTGPVFLLLALAPALPAQSVANGFDAQLFAPADVDDMDVFGGITPATGDVDEDGRADLVGPGVGPFEVVRFLGQPGGGLGDKQIVVLPADVGAFVQPLLGDLDGDGYLDLLARGTVTNLASFLHGAGNGSFGAGSAAASFPPSSYLAQLADLDEDGVLDVVFAVGGAPTHVLHWMRGHGDGTFGAATPIGPAVAPTGLIVADLDGDALPDVACLDAQQVAVRHGLGGGAFAPPQLWSGFAFSGPDAADMDLDGALDLLHVAGNDVGAILHGLGAGGFGEALYVQLAPFTHNLRAVDLERDGLPDLLGLGGLSAVVLAQRMDRDGPIGAPASTPLPGGGAAGILVHADFDGDGLQDAASTDLTSFKLVSLTNALGPFVDLGLGIPSVQGGAHLQGFGVPQPGSAVSVQVTCPAFAPGLLVGGLTALDAPFGGSTFVPDAGFVVPVAGVVSLGGTWPAGYPAGVPLYLQSVHPILGGGKVISNALMIVPE
ncbi:MAG TPA: VCBS repeat-containing protein [Planctomycetota bacterium]|nr:VCBS repeat-containing protein [Planctomycetota bacterium]